MSYSEPDIEQFIPGVAGEYQIQALPNPDLLPLVHTKSPPAPRQTTSTSTSTSTSSATTTPTTFPLFTSLPSELRLKIWHLLLPPHGRIVKARPYAISERKRMVNKITHKKAEFLFSSPSRPPVLLSVCREARAEAQRLYRLSFGFDHPLLASRVYFCGARDTLYFEFTDSRFYTNLGYFTSTIWGEGCTRCDMDRVQRVAVSHRLVIGRPNAIRKWVRRLVLFGDLRELIVAVERGENKQRVRKGEAPPPGPVGNEACLVDVEDWDEADEGLRRLRDEVEAAREVWEGDDIMGWKHRAQKVGLDCSRGPPKIKVMEIVNFDDGREARAPSRTGKKSALSSLNKFLKRLQR